MKKLVGISMVLVLLIMSGFINKAEQKETPGLQVYSIHEITVKPGVNEKEFEDFIRNEVAPIYRLMEGQDLFLAKGHVGQRKGLYAIFITFKTVQDRDRIYPLSGDGSEEFDKAMEGTASIWEKFDTMAEGFDGMHNTDYVNLNY